MTRHEVLSDRLQFATCHCRPPGICTADIPPSCVPPCRAWRTELWCTVPSGVPSLFGFTVKTSPHGHEKSQPLSVIALRNGTYRQSEIRQRNGSGIALPPSVSPEVARRVAKATAVPISPSSLSQKRKPGVEHNHLRGRWERA